MFRINYRNDQAFSIAKVDYNKSRPSVAEFTRVARLHAPKNAVTAELFEKQTARVREAGQWYTETIEDCFDSAYHVQL